MQQNNQKMFKLTGMIFRVIVTEVANFPPFTGSDLDRYTAAITTLHPACNTYLVILQNDEVECTPADVTDLRTLIRRMIQAEFFNFLDALEETRDYIVKKVEEAPKNEEQEQEGGNEGEEVDENVVVTDDENGEVTDGAG